MITSFAMRDPHAAIQINWVALGVGAETESRRGCLVCGRWCAAWPAPQRGTQPSHTAL